MQLVPLLGDSRVYILARTFRLVLLEVYCDRSKSFSGFDLSDVGSNPANQVRIIVILVGFYVI